MKKPFNPFLLIYNSKQKHFLERDKFAHKLKESIENGHNVAVYSWRRMGKTTLVSHLLESLDHSKEFETLYVDLNTTQNKEEAIAVLALAIYDRYGKGKSGVSNKLQPLLSQLGVSMDAALKTDKPDINIGAKSFSMTEKLLSAMGNFLNERKKKVVIALDEFQQISNYEDGNEVAVFKAWVQQFPAIRFVFIGDHLKMMTEMFAEKNRPFYETAQLMRLDPFSLEVYTSYIQSHFDAKGKSISEEQISIIYRWARGQTYTIQLICHHLYNQCKQVKEADVHLVMENILDEQQAVFTNFARMLTRHQWKLFKAIAKEEPLYSPLSKDFVYKHQLGAVSTVGTALKALQKLELVVEEEGAFLVHDVLVARWMARLV